MRALTSLFGLRQLSDEKANTVSTEMFSAGAASTVRRSASTPAA